jgi:hypothetical protein
VAAIEKCVEDVDATVVALNELTNVYEGQYNKVKDIIAAGKGRIAAIEAFTNAVLGVAIGTTVGLSLGAIPLLAASTSKITKTLTEVGGEVTEWATAQGVDQLRSGTPGTGGDAALARMDPLLKRLDIYRDAADSYRQLAMLAKELGALAAVSTWCAVTKANARELATTGTLSGSVKGPELERQVVALERAGDAGWGVRWRDAAPGLLTALAWSVSPVFIKEGLHGLRSPLLGLTLGMGVALVAYAAALPFRPHAEGPSAPGRRSRSSSPQASWSGFPSGPAGSRSTPRASRSSSRSACSRFPWCCSSLPC